MHNLLILPILSTSELWPFLVFSYETHYYISTSGIPASYFSYDITKWELNGLKHSDGLPLVDAKAMKVGRFPLFLEGPVRYMKTITTDKAGLQDMYQRVYTSGLRDEKLKMYKLSGDLTGQSYDMGRMMAFTPGWLENGSVWMHMMYKYYLELIRGGLFEEFFSEMKGGGMLPFMDPDVYGRSLMECSSFIASSAFPDPETQGRGFSARLSGSTAEFLSMWKLMFVGPEVRMLTFFLLVLYFLGDVNIISIHYSDNYLQKSLTLLTILF